MLELLCQLQKADTEILQIESSRNVLQERLNQLQTLLSRGESELQEKREKVSNVQKFYDEKQGELKENMDRAVKAKAKLTLITKQKEYLAAQKEIEYLKQVNAQKEEETAKLMEAIQEFRVGITSDEEKVGALKSELQEEEKTNAQKLEELNITIDSLMTKRKVVSNQCDTSILRKYERILKAREGLAVIPVIEETCTGCNMRIPPQQYIQLLQTGKLMNCPQCQRFIFVPEDTLETTPGIGVEASA